MHGKKFFGFVSGMGLLPDAYQGELKTLQRVQDEALQQRGPMMMKKFGQVSRVPVAFVGVRLFEADRGEFSDEQTVVFDRGHITAVGSSSEVSPPKGARVINGRGKTLVPGLWDTHMHIGNDTRTIFIASNLFLQALGYMALVHRTSIREPMLIHRHDRLRNLKREFASHDGSFCQLILVSRVVVFTQQTYGAVPGLTLR
jgi:hypothetical protein